MVTSYRTAVLWNNSQCDTNKYDTRYCSVRHTKYKHKKSEHARIKREKIWRECRRERMSCFNIYIWWTLILTTLFLEHLTTLNYFLVPWTFPPNTPFYLEQTFQSSCQLFSPYLQLFYLPCSVIQISYGSSLQKYSRISLILTPRGFKMWISEREWDYEFEVVNFTAIRIQRACFSWKIWTFFLNGRHSNIWSNGSAL